MVLDDLLCDREAQPRAIFLAEADKRLEHLVTNRRLHSRTVVVIRIPRSPFWSAMLTPTWPPPVCAAWQPFSNRL